VRSPVAGLTTRGRCLIAAGAACVACALVLDERDLLRIGVLLIALPLLSALLCGLSLLRLEATRAVQPQPLAVGDAGHVEVQLRALSRTPLAGMLISDRIPSDVGITATFALGRLRSGSTATVHYPVTPRLRGRRPLGPLQVVRADPLGLVELLRTVGEGDAVVVRPRVEYLDGSFPVSGSGNDHSARPSGGHSVRDAQLRTYVAGDDMRTIHWPSTARRDELMVRTAEQGHATGTAVLLDIRRNSHTGAGEQSSLERAVSLAASVSVHLHRIGVPVRVLTSDGTPIAAGEAGLDELALLQPSDEAELGAVINLIGTDALIAIFGRLDTDSATRLLDNRASSAHAVHLSPSPGAPLLRAAGWTVTEAAAMAPLSELWSPARQQNAGKG